MVLDKSKTEKGLKKKGFTECENRSDDHKTYELIKDGRMILWTKLSHGSKSDLGDPLIALMSRQCRLSKKDFMDLINCPLSKEEYFDILGISDSKNI
jgi:hypothetical protein